MSSLITIVVSSPASSFPWLQVLAAFGPLFIGVAVAAIAYRQMETARNKLKLDLFERRVDIFDDFRELQQECFDAYKDPTGTSCGYYGRDRFTAAFSHSRWIFNDAVADALHDMGKAYFAFVGSHNEVRQHMPAGSGRVGEGLAIADRALADDYHTFESAVQKVRGLIEPMLRLTH